MHTVHTGNFVIIQRHFPLNLWFTFASRLTPQPETIRGTSQPIICETNTTFTCEVMQMQ